MNVNDQGELKDKYPKHWALLADKGIKEQVKRLELFFHPKEKT